MKPKNDVKWRILDDDGYDLLKKYPDNLIIVETEITFRIDYAKYIDLWGELTTAHENVKRFAFFV